MSAAVQTNGRGHGGVAFVVAAASLGGISAFRQLLAPLPSDLAAPVVLVQHRAGPQHLLAEILQRSTRLAVADAAGGVRPAPGNVYVADGARQLLLDAAGRFRYAPPGSGSRADPLLESAARAHGETLLAVILTGRLDDGARGAVAVKAAGGRVIAQDEATSAAFAMPSAAIATGCVDFVLPPAAIAAAVTTLAMVPAAAELFRVARPPWARSAA